MKDAPPPSPPPPTPTRIFKVLKFYTLELPKIKIIPHTSDFFFFFLDPLMYMYQIVLLP